MSSKMGSPSADFDVIIVGAGSAGCGAAYGLKDYGYNIALIDRNPILGGNATVAWVDTWLQGMIPPYLEQIILDLETEKDLPSLRSKYWLRGQFSKTGYTNSLLIDKEELSNRYKTDLTDKVTLFLSYEFLLAVSDKYAAQNPPYTLNEIVIRDLKTGQLMRLRSKFFIDASADGVLCRSNGARIGVDYLCGRDAKSMFGEANAQKDVSTPKLRDRINEPSLLYEIMKGGDDSKWLDPVTSVFATLDEQGKIQSLSKPSYISGDGFGTRIINPMTGEGLDAYEMVIENGYPLNYEIYKIRMLEHWKYVKLSCQQAFEQNKAKFRAYSSSLKDFSFTGKFASFVGIRESYRIVCDYMMRQSDLTVLITSENVEKNRYIGETSHHVDFHDPVGLASFKDFNANELRPCGIKYDSVIPKKMKNVLIASRCYGTSQIFLASARGNFTMAYLGFSVGNAVRLCLENNLCDVRNVNVKTLQSDDYSQFNSRVKILESLYKTSTL